jgi:hypothetical protein
MISGRNLESRSCNQFLRTEEIRVNTTVNQDLTLNSRDLQRSSDFCYLGSTVSGNGGARTDVNESRELGDHSPN